MGAAAEQLQAAGRWGLASCGAAGSSRQAPLRVLAPLVLALQRSLPALLSACRLPAPHAVLRPCHRLPQQATEEGGGATRVVYIDAALQKAGGRAFESNRVVTSKYNFVTFLPIFLFEMFSRVAYLYFLLQVGAGAGGAREACSVGGGPAGSTWVLLAASPPTPPPLPTLSPQQACLSWWSVISPFSGYGSTAALLFVLAVAGVKAVWEDVKRHQEDKRMNTSITHRVNADGERGRERCGPISLSGPAACCPCRPFLLPTDPAAAPAPPGRLLQAASRTSRGRRWRWAT